MIINYHEDTALIRALETLERDNVFVYPTDTIYGFGGNANSLKILDKLYFLKQRPENMPVSMIVRNKDMISEYAHVSITAERLIDKFLPGALTLVLPAKNKILPDKLFNLEGFLGFRIPDHEFCRAMTRDFNRPIITSSVNLSGKAPLNDINSINDLFGKEVDLMISDPKLDSKAEPLSSTVVMILKDGSMKVLREAAIPASQLNKVLA